jgi:4-hydroxy-2-oxoheptanedioate aldolase
MIANRLKQIWSEGRPTINGWCWIGNSFTAEIMAAQGFDSVTIDLQHGALDYSHALPMLQAMRASGVTLLARAPWLDPAIIMKLLDAGAYGIICPMVNTAEEAARFVSYLRYPPQGDRSFGPARASLAAGSNYAAEANGDIVTFAMVETALAMQNLDAIAATPGLDGLYVGPADLSFSLSQGRLTPAFDREEPEIVAALHRVLAACKANGLRAALHCGTPDYAARATGWGFDMTTVGGDSRILSQAAASAVARFRDLTSANTEAAPARESRQ